MNPGEVWTKAGVNRVIVITSDDRLVGLVVNSQGQASLTIPGLRAADMQAGGWKYKGRAVDIYDLKSSNGGPDHSRSKRRSDA